MQKFPHNAINVSKEWVPPDYGSVVDESLLRIGFAPDIFQKQAFYFLSKRRPVFVSAHTSSGKTLVAEYAISLAIRNGRRAIYTSPIKALSNQKFHDFKKKFESVGIVTGDVQVNPSAQCLIMTTEILRNQLYKNTEIVQETDFVIFDEVHYVNDQERGVVWEEAIIMLPERITLVMLSATIPNAVEFSEWVGRTKGTCVYVISTNKRAVPLEFAIYHSSEAFMVEDQQRSTAKLSAASLLLPTNFPHKLPHFSSRAVRCGSGRFRIMDLASFILNRNLVPSIFFCFSKKSCNYYGEALESLNLTTTEEKKKITSFLQTVLENNLSEEDRHLPQIKKMSEQVYRGLAVHHSGLLPIVRECVEILFSQNLIKILIATETFAVGVNMPAKCCVFLGITKIDSGHFRTLTGSEFIQMSGRAGRRGMDKVGTVIIAGQKLPHIDTVRGLVHGSANDLWSRFRLSFSLILTAIRNNMEVEELMKKSFRENKTQSSVLADMRRLSALESVPKFKCERCVDIFSHLEALGKIVAESNEISKTAVKEGAVVVTKRNEIVRCESVMESGLIRVRDYGDKLEGVLFQRRLGENGNNNGKLGSLEAASDGSRGFHRRMAECENAGYLPLPPTIYKKCERESADVSEVLFAVKDGRICFETGGGDVKFLSVLYRIKASFESLVRSECLKCPEYEKHYFDSIESEKVAKEITAIKNRHSRESLQDIEEYAARCKYLRIKGFVVSLDTAKGESTDIEASDKDMCESILLEVKEKLSLKNSGSSSLTSNLLVELPQRSATKLTLKGKIAAEIRTVNEVFVVEMMFNNVFATFSPEELAAAFSAMICEEAKNEEVEILDEIRDKIETLDREYERHVEELKCLGITQVKGMNHSSTSAVYRWACGDSLGDLIAAYNIQEGSFVRLILRLEECCNEMIAACSMLGDSVLEQKFATASQIIKRGVVFAPSLYI